MDKMLVGLFHWTIMCNSCCSTSTVYLIYFMSYNQELFMSKNTGPNAQAEQTAHKNGNS